MIVSIVIRVTVTLLLTVAAAFVLRRASAAVRHAVWAGGLLVALAVPVASVALPAWSVIPASGVVTSVLTEFTDVTAPVSAHSESNSARTLILALIWCVGVLVVLARIVLGELALATWKRRAHPVHSPEWLAAIAALPKRVPHSSRVQFLECEWIDTPCTWGTVHPTILLPTAGARWPESRRACALIHELAHVRRFDAATNLVGRIVCAIHWYNPLVWMAARAARLAQEEACDNAVLAEQMVPTDYAALLLEVCGTNTFRGGNMIAALGLTRTTGTALRVRSVLDTERHRSPVTARGIAVAALFGAAILVVVATVAPAQNRPVAQWRPDSATMAQLVRRICDGRVSKGDSNVVSAFTFRGRLNQGPDSASRRVVEYSLQIKGCGKPPR